MPTIYNLSGRSTKLINVALNVRIQLDRVRFIFIFMIRNEISSEMGQLITDNSHNINLLNEVIVT